jgi:methyl-accepting chemotaxis protein
MSSSSTPEEAEDHVSTTATTNMTVDADTQRTVDSIKNIAKNIREASSRIRDTVRTLHQSGAIDELTQAIQEAMIATRDTTQEISATARDLRERGVIRDTAGAIEETAIAAKETAETVKGSAQQVKKAAPKTAETLRDLSSKTRKTKKN